MIIIFIAAGMSSRLSPLTDDLPKCMLTYKGRPILHHNINLFEKNDITKFYAVVGYKKEQIKHPHLKKIVNDNFQNNNILFSLMYAREILEKAMNENQSVIISYSDIIYSQEVANQILKTENEITAIVDTNWLDAYQGRTLHPISEAEKAYLNNDSQIMELGKNINYPIEELTEFIGLLKLSPKGIENWLTTFDKLNQELELNDEIEPNVIFQKSYLTHFMNFMIKTMNFKITAKTISGGWREFDTPEDYEKLKNLNF